jgi:predicted nucleotidyltransferase component of viral defense system
MKLHHSESEFEELIVLASQTFNIPPNAVRKDYFITLVLQNLANSIFIESVVFKGGTSLSKCYPNSIERFSEDIDLTYIPENEMSNKQISRKLKSIEKSLIGKGHYEKINGERNDRNKSSFVWFNEEFKDIENIKLEIGSSVKPHPYSKKTLKSYIHEYLESINENEAIEEYELLEISLNVLNVERTFVDKLMSVKRHAICGTLSNKVRHIYDIVKLYEMNEIQNFMSKREEFKRIIYLTKQTDSIYLEKRNIPEEYNPLGAYAFETWSDKFSKDIKSTYENLHNTLLYTDEKQEFDKAIDVFNDLNQRLIEINE